MVSGTIGRTQPKEWCQGQLDGLSHAQLSLTPFPVLENLQRAVRAAEMAGDGEAVPERRWKLEVAADELQTALTSDTRLHIRRAMSTKPSTGEKPGDEVVVATEK